MHQNRDTSYLAEIIRALKQLDGAGSLKEINSTIEQNKTMPYINTNHSSHEKSWLLFHAGKEIL